MAATARLLSMPRPHGLGQSHEFFSSSAYPARLSRSKTPIVCLNRAGLSSTAVRGVKAAAGCSTDCVLVAEPKTDKGVDLGLLSASVADIILPPWEKFIRQQRPWRLNIQMLVEKAIVDCRFFTVLAIAGSLVGSVLCFIEGCVLVLESYFQYFHALSQMSEKGHVVPILIEAIDMFLVGSAMFIFGMALHVMFVGQQNLRGKGSQHSSSTLSGNFNLQKLPSWVGMESPMQAKSKIGHAVMMILQVQVLEKLKSIPVTGGVDLACFAGAVFLSSASLLILARTVAARVEPRI